MDPHGGAIAVAFVQLLASMLSGLLIDTVGRIPLLITSSVFMSLALASFGSYVYYEQTNKLAASSNFIIDNESINSDWIPLLCVLVFTVAFSLGKFDIVVNARTIVNQLLFLFKQESHQYHRYSLENYFHWNIVELAVQLQQVLVISVHFWVLKHSLIFKNFLGCMVHFGCTRVYHVLDYFLLLCLYQRQKVKI